MIYHLGTMLQNHLIVLSQDHHRDANSHAYTTIYRNHTIQRRDHLLGGPYPSCTIS